MLVRMLRRRRDVSALGCYCDCQLMSVLSDNEEKEEKALNLRSLKESKVVIVVWRKEWGWFLERSGFVWLRRTVGLSVRWRLFDVLTGYVAVGEREASEVQRYVLMLVVSELVSI